MPKEEQCNALCGMYVVPLIRVSLWMLLHSCFSPLSSPFPQLSRPISPVGCGWRKKLLHKFMRKRDSLLLLPPLKRAATHSYITLYSRSSFLPSTYCCCCLVYYVLRKCDTGSRQRGTAGRVPLNKLGKVCERVVSLLLWAANGDNNGVT